jgi:WD40 repeat protein
MHLILNLICIEIGAEKSCIYDIQWLNSYELACGGGDKFISVFDVNTCTRTALLKGHSESVKSITQFDKNPFVIASGSRDGTILIYDLRCNKHDLHELTDSSNQTQTFSFIRPMNTIQNAHFIEKSHQLPANVNTNTSRILKSKSTNSNSTLTPTNNSAKSYPVSCVLFQNEFHLVSSGKIKYSKIIKNRIFLTSEYKLKEQLMD